jgi:dipeptidase E
MKLLLTSAGITNPSIHQALVDLLGKPIAQSNALVIPTAIYPFPGGPQMAGQMIRGLAKSPLCELGWRSLGVLELTALASIEKEVWTTAVRDADALLVWGGDVLYLSYWMRESGLAALLPALRDDAVYVGVSAGSMATTSLIGETYVESPRGVGSPLTSTDVMFSSPEGDVERIFVTAHGLGLVDFSLIPHYGHEQHLDASPANAPRWAAMIPAPTYAIDDQTAIKVSGGAVEVVSEGQWELFS